MEQREGGIAAERKRAEKAERGFALSFRVPREMTERDLEQLRVILAKRLTEAHSKLKVRPPFSEQATEKLREQRLTMPSPDWKVLWPHGEEGEETRRRLEKLFQKKRVFTAMELAAQEIRASLLLTSGGEAKRIVYPILGDRETISRLSGTVQAKLAKDGDYRKLVDKYAPKTPAPASRASHSEARS